MTTEAIELSKNPALGVIKMEAVESVSTSQAIGRSKTEYVNF